MSVWDDFIAVNETEIVRLQLNIDRMLAGTLEMRLRDTGEWTSQNATWISEDRETIARLRGIIRRAELELGLA